MKILQKLSNHSIIGLLDSSKIYGSTPKMNHSINSITFTSKYRLSRRSTTNAFHNEDFILSKDELIKSNKSHYKSKLENLVTQKIKEKSISKSRTKMHKLIRVTTVSGSLRSLLTGQLKFMNQYYEVVGVSSYGEGLEDVRKNEGVRTQGIKMTRSITPFRDLIATYKLYRFFKEEKPYIVHTHTPKAGTLGMLAARLAGVPHRIHTVAGLPLLEINGLKRSLLNMVEKLTYSCATKILPNSYGLKDIILQNKFAKQTKVKVIGHGSSNGINTSYYNVNNISQKDINSLKNQLMINERDIVFLYIGRIVKDKGINELINAFDNLSKQFDNLKLILVGGRENHLDPLLKSTEAIIKTNNNILELGWQKDIRPFVAISSILTHPSYREGFPNVVLQAGSMGLPCIVSNINGCNEIIEQNINGIIIQPKNTKNLESAMKFMIDNPDKISEMKANSRTRILKHYQQEFVWDEILKFYKTLE